MTSLAIIEGELIMARVHLRRAARAEGECVFGESPLRLDNIERNRTRLPAWISFGAPSFGVDGGRSAVVDALEYRPTAFALVRSAFDRGCVKTLIFLIA